MDAFILHITLGRRIDEPESTYSNCTTDFPAQFRSESDISRRSLTADGRAGSEVKLVIVVVTIEKSPRVYWKVN